MILFPTGSSIASKKRVKFGIDPTSSRLHLGHFIPIRYVKKLQKENFDITIVLGTFTAQLGDPSGRDKTRPMLSKSVVLENSIEIAKIIRYFLGQDVKIFCNHLLHENMKMSYFVSNIASKFNLSHMISRDAFSERLKKNQSIAMHELIVPMLQAMDSVHLQSEIEVGGQDQLFNFKITRDLQEQHGQIPQVCVLMPIINGTDGRKMSKSYNNCIYLDDTPNDIFGKVMSISDNVMKEWFPLLSDLENNFCHPLDAKKELAFDIVRQIHNQDAAIDAKNYFTKTIQNKEVPIEIIPIVSNNLLDAITKIRKCSKTHANRLISQNAVKVNDEIVLDVNFPLNVGMIIKVGKRDYAKIS